MVEAIERLAGFGELYHPAILSWHARRKHAAGSFGF
jgi:hypothetical protein